MNPKKSQLLKSLGLGIISLALSPVLHAADGSWNVNASGDWATAADPPWVGGVVPGSTITTNNSDTATFDFTLTSGRIVTVDTDRNIGNIRFGNTGSGFYSLRTGNLLLSDGGSVETLAANGDHVDGITAAIAIQGIGGSASFTAGATSAGSTMSMTGLISGVSTSGNTTTLTLTGSNAGENRIASISDGAAGGNIAIVKEGSGQWLMAGVGTYTGGTTLNDGILKIVANTNNALGTGGDVTLNGGELWISHSSGRNLGRDAVVGGNATITSDRSTAGAGVTNSLAALSIGAHTLTIQGGSNVTSGVAGYTFTGATTLTGNAVFDVLNPVAVDTSTLLTLGSTLETGGFIATFQGTGDSLVSGVVGGTGGIAKSGSGTLTLATANTFDGSLTLNGGTILVGDANALGDNANAVTINGGTLASSSATNYTLAQDTTVGGDFTLGQAAGGTGTLNLNGTMDLGGATRTITVDSSAATISGAISNGGLIKDGAGMLTLDTTNTFADGLTLNAGVLRIDASSNLLLGAGTLTLNSGELWVANPIGRNQGRATTVGGDVTITSDRSTAGAGVTHGLASLSIGAHTLTIQGGDNVTSGVAGYTFTGATTLTGAATFNVQNPAAGGTSTLLTLGSTVINGGFLVTFDGTGDSSVTGAMSGSGGVTKSGAGSLTLDGLNTYTGDTTVNAGTMILADNARLTFEIGGDGVNNTLTGTGIVTLDGDFTFDLTGAGTTLGDSWNIVDVANLTETFGSTFNVNGFARDGGGSGAGIWLGSANSTTYQFDTSVGTLTVVPEPATWVLLLGGLSALTVVRRRRRA